MEKEKGGVNPISRHRRSFPKFNDGLTTTQHEEETSAWANSTIHKTPAEGKVDTTKV